VRALWRHARFVRRAGRRGATNRFSSSFPDIVV
jgi:hypothetical protein